MCEQCERSGKPVLVLFYIRFALSNASIALVILNGRTASFLRQCEFCIILKNNLIKFLFHFFKISLRRSFKMAKSSCHQYRINAPKIASILKFYTAGLHEEKKYYPDLKKSNHFKAIMLKSQRKQYTDFDEYSNDIDNYFNFARKDEKGKLIH